MAEPKTFQKSALVIGVLSTLESHHADILSTLQANFGPLELESPVMDFPFTDYYDAEMLAHPVRYLLLFRNLVDPSTLADLKLRTNALERTLSPTARRVNLDPGLLSLSSFILATCKDRAHRIPLHSGIYAEVTLIYQSHSFQPLPWTYADYRSPALLATLQTFRTRYRDLLRSATNC